MLNNFLCLKFAITFSRFKSYKKSQMNTTLKTKVFLIMFFFVVTANAQRVTEIGLNGGGIRFYPKAQQPITAWITGGAGLPDCFLKTTGDPGFIKL